MSNSKSDCPFPLLADPEHYVSCPWNLTELDDQRAYWIDLFRSHIPRLIDEAKRQSPDDPDMERRGRTIEEYFYPYLDSIRARPNQFGRLDIITICHARQDALAKAGIEDAYLHAKKRENEAALPLLPALLDELDCEDTQLRPQLLMEGVFAGNIFDLGATQALDLIDDKPVDFYATRRQLQPRPWLIDDLDRWIEQWHDRPHRSAVLFVDNAGCDVILGMIPFARELLRRGTDVLLTANSRPSLNDVTHVELAELIDRIARHDVIVADARADGRLELVASGNDVPLIDLSKTSPELAEAVIRRRVDLVVLEGMGRAIESNLDAAFACDTIKIAMLKDSGVAAMLGGQIYELVMKYEPV